VKLLFDANLSPRLETRLQDLFPDSTHVFSCGDIAEDDALIWDFAKSAGLVIVSKDHDFQQMSYLYGAPPKVVLVRLGNASTASVEQALRKNFALIVGFVADKDKALLVIEP
jgi:predicted nuclease of predicted toxin-antitoxin system